MPSKRQPTRDELQRMAYTYSGVEQVLRNQPTAPTPTLLADQGLALMAVGRYREALEQYLTTLTGDPYAEPAPKAKRTRKAGLPSPAAAFASDAEALAEREPS